MYTMASNTTDPPSINSNNWIIHEYIEGAFTQNITDLHYKEGDIVGYAVALLSGYGEGLRVKELEIYGIGEIQTNLLMQLNIVHQQYFINGIKIADPLFFSV